MRPLSFKRWLLRSKTSPPFHRSELILRPRLIERLESSQPGNVVVVRAPAGFGKSCLLVEWYGWLRKRGEKCAWVTLDQHDDAETIISHVAFAFHNQGVDCAGVGLLEPDGNEQNPIELTKLLFSILEDQNSQLTIVFDDCETAAPEIVTDVFTFFIRWAPANLRIVFAGRSIHGLKFSQLALRNTLIEVSAEDLRFSRAEIAEVLGIDHSDLVDSLCDDSEGWPALVRLMQGRGRSSNGVQTGGLFEQYLDDVVFSSLDRESLEFLQDASICEDAPIDFFRDACGFATVISHIEQPEVLGAFVSVVGASSEALRIHPLLRDRLSARLAKHNPNRVIDLHRRAAKWLAEHGMELAAIRHACKTRELRLVEGILESIGGPTWLLFQGAGHLRRVNEQLVETVADVGDKDVLGQYPLIALTDAMTKTKSGKLMQARMSYNAAASASGVSESKRNIVEFSSFLTNAALHCYAHVPLNKKTVETLLSYENDIVADTPFLQGSIWNVDTFFANEQGDFGRAITSGKRSIGRFRAGPSKFGEAHVQLHIAYAHTALGQPNRAGASIKSGKSLITNSLSNDRELTFARKTLTQQLSLLLRPNQAENYSTFADFVHKEIGHVNVWFEYIAMACGLVVDSCSLARSYDSARRYLDEYAAIALSRGQDRLHKFLGYLGLLIDNRETGVIGRSVPSDRTDEASCSWREALVYAELAPSNSDVAGRLLESALKNGNILAQCRLSLLAARRFWDEERAADAFVAVADACKAAQHSGYILDIALNANFLHEIQPSFCSFWQDRDGGVSTIKCLESVLESAGKTGDCRTSSNLTGKERKVLDALAAGFSDKAIGQSLELSHHTVRFHLKNIYRKLGANSRVQAVQSARKLGFLEETYSNE